MAGPRGPLRPEEAVKVVVVMEFEVVNRARLYRVASSVVGGNLIPPDDLAAIGAIFDSMSHRESFGLDLMDTTVLDAETYRKMPNAPPDTGGGPAVH